MINRGRFELFADGKAEVSARAVDLVGRSLRFEALVRRMDDEIYGQRQVPGTGPACRPNPVSDQIRLLNTAFGRA